MLLDDTAQHRAKHFDLLLARELVLIEREHEQNLITQKNFENSIRRESNRSLDPNRQKLSVAVHEIYREENQSSDQHKIRIFESNYSNDRSRLSISSSNSSQNQTDAAVLPPVPRYRRQCTKTHRLPPILKANPSNRRRKQSTSDLQWIGHFQQSNRRKESVHDALAKINEEISKITLPALTPIQKQVHSFMETLPRYTGIQRGFDNFAPASLYSSRAPVIMK